MNDIKQKALALLNEVQDDWYQSYTEANVHELFTALCRAIEQHEAFRQEVSDALKKYFSMDWNTHNMASDLHRFIIPAPELKPDPLVEALDSLGLRKADEWAGDIRKALAARGLTITTKEKD